MDTAYQGGIPDSKGQGAGVMDTSVSCTNKEVIWVSSDERSMIRKVQRLAEQNPDDVFIIRDPKENDGCIYAKMPYSYLRLAPKRKSRKLSDDERKVLSDRLAAIRNVQKHGESL